MFKYLYLSLIPAHDIWPSAKRKEKEMEQEKEQIEKN